MERTFPGMTVETSRLEPGSSRALFAGIFAAGGITLSQVSHMTGLEPYLIQNWVKRGFVSSPKNRLYSQSQFARILLIQMLRESLQIEKICSLLSVLEGETPAESDDLIRDDELYHRYVDLLARGDFRVIEPASVERAAAEAAADFPEAFPGARRQLTRILEVMLYAHAAARLRDKASEILSSLP